jgi:glycosyltransferase involved in cell wall biosynthesis
MDTAPRPRLSLAVITRDERETLPRLLDAAAAFADEVVVVDCGSTDGTVELARDRGAIVVETDWPGFGAQKNRAFEACTGEWLLSLDADEVPDATLAEALAGVGRDDAAQGYTVERTAVYLGEPVRHAWSDEHIVRVVRRGHGRWSDVAVHETLVVDGAVEPLPGRLVHHSYRDLGEHWNKLVRYARAGAERADSAGRKFHVHQLVTHPCGAFLRRYVFKLGFIDGVRGLLIAGSAAASAFLKYAFLFDRQRRGPKRGGAG